MDLKGMRQAFMDQAREEFDRLVGQAGQKTSMDEIEEMALDAARRLGAKLAEDRVHEEDALLAEPGVCLKCGAPVRWRAGMKERKLQTLTGTVKYQRRRAKCPQCGAAFSPSGPCLEHLVARNLGSGGAADV